MTNDIYGSFKTRKHDFIAGIKLVKKEPSRNEINYVNFQTFSW